MKYSDIQTIRIDGKPYSKTEATQFTDRQHLDEWQQQLYTFLDEWFNDSPQVTVKTSGTTGTPKQIQLAKKNMLNSALATIRAFSLAQGCTLCLCLPVEYIAGKMMVVRAMALDANLIIQPPNGNPLALLTEPVDFAAMIPLQVINGLTNNEDFSKIKKLIIGGAPLPYATEQALQQIPTHCFATYGMTETITHIAIRPLNHAGEEQRLFYTALPGVSFGIDERNCLLVDAPALCDGVLQTNDVVELTDDFTFEWKGRHDHVINSGGIKLHPEQIEQKLSAVIENDFFIASQPDERLGEKVILYVEMPEEAKTIDTEGIHNTLGLFERPREIILCTNFVRTETGKINRKATIHKGGIILI